MGPAGQPGLRPGLGRGPPRGAAPYGRLRRPALRALPLPPHKPILSKTPPPAQTPHFDLFVQKFPTRRPLPMGFFPFAALQ